MTIIDQVLTYILAGGEMGKKKSPISPSLQAYCLDGDDFKGDKSKDLRLVVGLGGCNCCDYFYPMDNYVMLIEEKQLFAKMDSIKASYGANVNEEIIDQCIKQDLRLKVYGSLLVICRLKSQCATVNNMVKDKPYKFYLIVSDDEDVRAMEGLDASLISDDMFGELFSDMKSTLKIVEEFHVYNPDGFKQEFTALKSQQATSQKTP